MRHGGRSLGRSRHEPPVRTMSKMALSTARRAKRGGRPSLEGPPSRPSTRLHAKAFISVVSPVRAVEFSIPSFSQNPL